ncbi:MAG: ATP-binding cassette domain-containing protein [Defluviitaleaceae bacterium]|nr:ATP-binding cassette domain-containing protein [Defluviitaleaceae bacterium]
MLIEVKSLVKSYGDIHAVKGINFTVTKGSLFSFLGTNGAGKSTTISMLTTLLKPTSGTATIGGYDVLKNPDAVRNLIGIVFQDSVMDEILTVEENLFVRGSFYGLKGLNLKHAVKHVIALTKANGFSKQRYGTLSGGQRRRADIARALIHTPEILFLDEPTTGLDPKTRQDVWTLIRNLQKEKGMTIFLTTHYMEEAAESDEIVVIHKGEIRAQGTPEELKEQYCTDLLKITTTTGKREIYNISKTTDALPILDKKREQIAHVEIISGTLDDVFLNLTEGFENEHAH